MIGTEMLRYYSVAGMIELPYFMVDDGAKPVSKRICLSTIIFYTAICLNKTQLVK